MRSRQDWLTVTNVLTPEQTYTRALLKIFGLVRLQCKAKFNQIFYFHTCKLNKLILALTLFTMEPFNYTLKLTKLCKNSH